MINNMYVTRWASGRVYMHKCGVFSRFDGSRGTAQDGPKMPSWAILCDHLGSWRWLSLDRVVQK